MSDGPVQKMTGKNFRAVSRKLGSLNDLKLLQISWVFDLNFSESIGMIREKNTWMPPWTLCPGFHR